MINSRIQAWGRRLAGYVVAPLAASRISPNMLTVAGLFLSLFTAAVIAAGHVSIGGALLLFAGIFDMFDGALARLTGKSTTFGAFFDSTLDRIAEAGIGLGLLWYYNQHHNQFGATVLYLMIVGSLMISYARARAEGLNLECKVGLMARPERVIALAIGLLLGPAVTPWVLAILALTTWGTVLQRIMHVWRQTEGSSIDRPDRPRLFLSKRNRALLP
jgi:CDP-diacylglycerol--glycerol-3-phosphate 3-phosphatidyltransferase